MSTLHGRMSQMVLFTGVDQTISRLEALPEELRKQILRYVLHSRFARLSRPERRREEDNITHLRAFDWNIGVLRVCKTLHADDSDILNHENKWIKLVMYIDPVRLSEFLRNHDVHCIRQAAATNLRNYLAVVTITPLMIRCPRAETLLLPMEQLVTFCWFLRALDLANFMCYKFRFEIPALANVPSRKSK